MRWSGQSGAASARVEVFASDAAGGVEGFAQAAGVVVEQFGEGQDVDGDVEVVVQVLARGDENGGHLHLFVHAAQACHGFLGEQIGPVPVGDGGGGLLLPFHANTPSALHARNVRGCREVQSRLQTVGVFP